MNRAWTVWRRLGALRQARRGARSARFSRLARLVFEPLEDRRVLASVSDFVLDPAYEATSLIVQFEPEMEFAGSLRAHAAGTVVSSEWEIAPGLREVQLAAGMDLDEALDAYEDDPNVVFAEPDYRVRLNVTPNDPSFADQWPLLNTGIAGVPGADIRATDAWEQTMGDPSVVVAVIDTGIDYTHPDLAPNMWTNPGEIAGNNIDDDLNGYIDDIYGYDFANHDEDPMDDYYHGTHVAGTIAAVANNGIGIAGVAPNVRLMALKFLDASGGGLTSDAIAALNYAVANGASISNNSWGGGPSSQAFKTAIQYASSAGHIFVASAGNYDSNNDSSAFYPANYAVDNVISVAATDAGDHIAWFSNYGKTTVDLGAPGVDILSTMPTIMTGGMQASGQPTHYGTLSGTSMAAPHVAGVLALVRSVNPNTTAREAIEQVLNAADPVPSLASRTVTGGRLNAAAALGIVPVDTSLPRVVSSDPAGVISGPVDHIRFVFSEAMDSASFDVGDILGLNGPLGPVFVFSVEPSPTSNREFTVWFDPQTEAGEYSLLVGPHIMDLAGNEVDQDRDGVGGTDGVDDITAAFSISGSAVFASPNVPISIRGFDAFSSYLTIEEDLPIADLNLQLNLSFPRTGNLHVWLVSPAGTTINLSYRHGGNQADFVDTVFDDEAGISISDGEAPFTGSFQPDDPLSLLDGENAFGTWQLVIQNVSTTRNRGTLHAWSLEIVGGESGGGDPGGGGSNDPPLALDDFVTAQQDTPLVIEAGEMLGNDSDPNDDPIWIMSAGNGAGGVTQLNPDGSVTFWPALGSLAPDSFQYVVTDGVNAAVGTVNVTIQPSHDMHNLHNGYDVNDDGSVSPIDSLLIINQLNAYGSSPIIGLGLSTGKLYYDVIPDNVIAANDALAVVNYLNAGGAQAVGGGEGESALAGAALDSVAVDTLLACAEEHSLGSAARTRAARRRL